MGITWGERPGTRKSSSNPASVSAGYILGGVANESIAKALAIGYTPAIDPGSGLFRQNIEVAHVGHNLWNCDVTWGVPQKKEPEQGEFKWSFDTTGQTRHITQGLALINSYAPSGKPTIDHGGAIGVKDDGVDGVDVPDKAFKWNETHQLPLASFGFAYATILGEYTGAMNSSSFRGFPAGTVRFDGGVGGQSSKSPEICEVTFHFAVSPSESGLAIGSISGIDKLGWDYLWVRYEATDDTTAKKTTPVPRQVDVNRVLPQVNFSIFGIGS